MDPSNLELSSASGQFRSIPILQPHGVSTTVTTIAPPMPLPNLHYSVKSAEFPNTSGVGMPQHFNAGNVEHIPYTTVPVTVTDANAVKAENSVLPNTAPGSPAAVVSAATTLTTSTSPSSHDQMRKMLNIPISAKLPRTKRVFKVIILGNAGVGKTCLSFRFCNGRFPGQTEATVGVDFRERSIIMDGELIRVQLWDTAGQERYRQSIVSHYYRNVNAVVFVYDVNDPSSFQSLPEWIAECNKHSVTASNDTPHILIGNKCDLKTERRVRTDYAQIFADQNDMALFETSALADSEADHVESIFMTLVHKLQQSKPMHVQSDEERKSKEGRLLLKANEAAAQLEDDSWCC